jgi:hypothetical protein
MRVAQLILLVAFILLIAWIANHTYWEEVKVPLPPRGEAARNPFYAAQRLAEKLGARTRWDRVLTMPDRDGVLVVSTWNWGVSDARRKQMEHWVESGGRLIVDRSLITGNDRFQRWSGLSHETPSEEEEKQEHDGDGEPDFVKKMRLDPCRKVTDQASGRGYKLCGLDRSFLTSTRKMTWELRDEVGAQAARVNVGRGSVTMVNGEPFLWRDLLEGDHASLFVAATQLRSGDEVGFLSEASHESLLTLTWRYGAPVVVIALLTIALALWRNGTRFGPLVAATDTSRRSLAEQIRGTGLFALRFGGGEALHAATVRALNEAAGRRISAYARLPTEERLAALVRATGFAQDDLQSALYYSGRRRANELRSAIALLEAARRRILLANTRSPHGN